MVYLHLTSPKWLVVSRCIAAFIMGFIFINSLGVTVVLLLPGSHLEAIGWVSVFAFLGYSLLVMWCFHERSLGKVWGMLTVGILASCASSYGLLAMEKLI